MAVAVPGGEIAPTGPKARHRCAAGCLDDEGDGVRRAWNTVAAGLGLALVVLLSACGGGEDTRRDATAAQAALTPTKQAQAFRSATNFGGNGWYWNPAEPGTGFMFEAQGDAAFVGFFMYEAGTGKAVWYAAYGVFFADDTGRHFFFGDLRRYSGGQPISSATVPAGGTSTSLGPVSITFPAQGGANVILPGGRSMAATRFDFNGLGSTPKAFQPETGWYWNPAEGGRGFAIEVQNDRLFMAMFHYNEDGSPTWNIVQGILASGTLVARFEAYDGGQGLTDAYVPGGQRSPRGGFAVGFRSPCGGQVQRGGAAPVSIVRFTIPDSGLAPGAECRAALVAADVVPSRAEAVWSDGFRTALADLPVFHPGDMVHGRLDAATVADVDADAYRYWLEAGVPYTIGGSAPGVGTFTLAVHDSRGTLLASGPTTSQLNFTPTTSGVYVLMVQGAPGQSGLYRAGVFGAASGELRLSTAALSMGLPRTVQGVLRGQNSGSFSLLIGADGVASGSLTLASAPTAPLALSGSVASSGRVSLTAGTSLALTAYLGPDCDLTGTWSALPPGTGAGSLVGDCTGVRVLDNRAPAAGSIGMPALFRWGEPQPLISAGSNVDLDGDLVQFSRWRLVAKPPGSAAVIRPGAFPKALDADLPGDYVLELVVSDGKNDSPAVQATLRAVPANSLPVANAGPDRTVAVNTLMVLDGSASADPDGALSFRWELLAEPLGAGVAYTPDVAARAQLPFIAPLPGHYVFRLTVTDGVSVSVDEVTVVATRDGAPTAFGAPANLWVGVGSSVRLDGRSGSAAVLVPEWQLLSAPLGSQAVLQGPARELSVTLAPDVTGFYNFTLRSLDPATGGVAGVAVTQVQAVDLAGGWTGPIGPSSSPGASLISFSTDSSGALMGRLTVGFPACGRIVRLIRDFAGPQRLFDASGNTASFYFTGNNTAATLRAELRSSSRMTGTLALQLSAEPDCPAQTLVLPWEVTR